MKMKPSLKKFILSLTTSITTLIVALILTTHSVHADDTEVFISSGNAANVLLVFDLSHSMACSTAPSPYYQPSCAPGAGEKSRYEILSDSLTMVLNNLKDKTNLRIGLSVFGLDGDFASGIRWPITDISTDANDIDNLITAGTHQTHSIILKQLADYAPSGNTPIVDALLEAAIYFKGDLVSAGSSLGANESPVWDGSSYTGGLNNAAHSATYFPSTAWNPGNGSFNPTTSYISPINNSCDNNYIVILSDGVPKRNHSVAKIEALTGTSCVEPTGTQPIDGKCGPELVSYLANTDLQAAAGIAPSKVITHTIGFAVGGEGETYLRNLAVLGGGDFFSADNSTALEQSLETILTTISGENESFSGFSTSINASSLSSGNRIFMNMFKPSGDRSWIGNTKGYFIDPTKGLTDLKDAEAIDPATGQFYDTAQSFWSSADDGNKVEDGGLSGKLNPATRKIFTFTGTTAPIYPVSTALTKELALNDSAFDSVWFNVASDAEKDTLITQLQAAPMGDAMHANTVTLSYPGKKVLFTMTNQGLMHAFDVTDPTGPGDTTGGEELSAFIPQSLLSNIKDHVTPVNSSSHLYGLDGSITYWHDDVDNDRIINGAEKAYLYFGMRRGGTQYFALDVSNPSSPELAWRIDGGSAGFTTLGQTWSRPIITTVTLRGTPNQKVIIFGGGYDIAQDGKTTRSADTEGNGVYIVNAGTGALLWSTGLDASHTVTTPEMEYSIPSDLTVIDTDNDQQADRIYFGDMGGQVWRIDLPQTGSPDIIRLAEFADDTSANFRRFYSPPGAALIKSGGNLQYAIAIGSGFRAHPTSKGVDDRFYMIKDTNLASDGTASGSWTTVTDTTSSTDLYNVTLNLIDEGTAGAAGTKATAKAALDSAKGWYLELTNNGEKSLSPSLIFNNQLAFTTYTPATTTLTCGSPAGNGRLYLVNLKNGTPVKDIVVDNTLKAEDRSMTLLGIGIPGTPVPYFPPGKGIVDIYIGKQKILDIDNPMHRINWKVIE